MRNPANPIPVIGAKSQNQNVIREWQNFQLNNFTEKNRDQIIELLERTISAELSRDEQDGIFDCVTAGRYGKDFCLGKSGLLLEKIQLLDTLNSQLLILKTDDDKVAPISTAIIANAENRVANINLAVINANLIIKTKNRANYTLAAGGLGIIVAIIIAFLILAAKNSDDHASQGDRDAVLSQGTGITAGVFGGMGLILCVLRCLFFSNSALKSELQESLNALEQQIITNFNGITVLTYPNVTPEQAAHLRVMDSRQDDDCAVCQTETKPSDQSTVYTKVNDHQGETPRVDFSGPYHKACLKQVEQTVNAGDAKDQKQALRDPKTRAGAVVTANCNQTVELSPRQTHFRLFHLNRGQSNRLAPAANAGAAASGEPFRVSVDGKADYPAAAGAASAVNSHSATVVEMEGHSDSLTQSLLPA